MDVGRRTTITRGLWANGGFGGQGSCCPFGCTSLHRLLQAGRHDPMADPDRRSLLPVSARDAFLSTLHEQLVVRSAGFFSPDPRAVIRTTMSAHAWLLRAWAQSQGSKARLERITGRLLTGSNESSFCLLRGAREGQARRACSRWLHTWLRPCCLAW